MAIGSIVDFLNSQGKPSDFASRSALAKQNGIQNYTGTAAQNTQLLGVLQSGGTATKTTPTTPTPTVTSQSDIQKQIADKQSMVKQLQDQIATQNPDGTPKTTPTPDPNAPAKIVPRTDAEKQIADNLNKAQDGLAGNGPALQKIAQTNPNLEMTPALMAQFLAAAHQVVDPQTQQALGMVINDVNASLASQQKNYEATKGTTIQDFGTQLANQNNTAGANGVYLSTQNDVNNNNLIKNTNRTLSSLGATTGYNLGNTLRSGASQVGTENTGQFNLPTIATGQVGLGGQRGTQGTSGTPDLNYDPNSYKVGTITSGTTGGAGESAVNEKNANYQSQYNQLIGQNNSDLSATPDSLIKKMSGLPSGFTLPTTL